MVKKITLLCSAPSIYTHRYDSYRAGKGIFLSIQLIKTEFNFPILVSYHDVSLLSKQEIIDLIASSDVTLLGTSVWAAGPASESRRFFEHIMGTNCMFGIMSSTWVCTGGNYTGGSQVPLRQVHYV
jgi:hypothetical protein